MQTIYRPGQWYLIVIPGALVALPPDVPSETISRLWDRLPAEKTLAAVVDVLTTAAGGSFVAMPPFAAAVAEGGDVRIALRGGVVARVSCGTDVAYEFSGAEVTTWSERFIGGATRIEITVEETDAASALPVQSGIARAAAVSAELESSDAAPIVAVLGPSPRIDEVATGASAAALGGGPAPALALFGVPSAPPVDVAADGPIVAPSAASVVGLVDASPLVAEEPGAPESDVQDELPVDAVEPDLAEPAPEALDAPDAPEVEPDGAESVDEPVAEAPVAEPAEPDSESESESAAEPVAEPAASTAPQPVLDEFSGYPVVESDDLDATVASEPETAPDEASDPFADSAPVDSALVEPALVDPELPSPTAPPLPTIDVPDDNGLDEHTWEPPQQSFAPMSDIDEFEQLFGETLHSGSTPAPVAPVIPPLPVMDLGDHDGATISVDELAALRRQRATSDDVATQVLPVVPSGNGRIRVSTGQVVELDRTVIIGRRPRSTRASGENLPNLVAVDSPQQDISRNHLEVRPEAGTVVVIDLHTTNGSTLIRPGAEPVRLHPGEQTLVLTGDVVDLGDGVTVVFEDLP